MNQPTEAFRPHVLADISPRSPVPGGVARFVHSDSMTLAFWTFEAGAVVGTHSHPHEQVTNVLEGSFELVVDGIPYCLEAGTGGTIPPNIPHSGRALTACTLIDVFHPVREDYRL